MGNAPRFQQPPSGCMCLMTADGAIAGDNHRCPVHHPPDGIVERPCETVRVKWYCGMYVGPAKWQGVDRYEPDECCAEGEAEVDREDWQQGSAVVFCTKCGSRLHQADSHLELIE